MNHPNSSYLIHSFSIQTLFSPPPLPPSISHLITFNFLFHSGTIPMATASATLSTAMSSAAPISAGSRRQRQTNAHFISGLNSFSGLKAHNNVVSLGLPVCADQSFAKIVSSLKYPSKGKGKNGGGALSSTCNAAGEIFRIAAIINGLVLIGVAVGFVLLRIEASVEEAE
ncbi:uncharacterized protein LOC101210164 [Cucumis sativus]|uniref:uncharacterized protein LOC101210164 n=1 Tax=Cucumis sativus TaxID=3659 RepID=UPI0002B4517D|nr:uncharacterized protein LOC101210164 [Cucumis sativus]KAE8645889.1 hypothetical protein Csa_017701 [Cucumis sativus]